jgi:hypothetical protein
LLKCDDQLNLEYSIDNKPIGELGAVDFSKRRPDDALGNGPDSGVERTVIGGSGKRPELQIGKTSSGHNQNC